VLTDAKQSILSVNAAFVDMTGEASAVRLKGQQLGDYLGRSGIDADVIVDQLREYGNVRNFATVLRGRSGAIEEVEVSAVSAPGVEGDGFGFSIRSIARRTRDLPPQPKDMPRSVEQLTELVGRMSLKDIVRESTDLIERLCIEAALEYTSDNRASAAEILGVSRQSLYSKLHRHGLGNLVGDGE
jgi:transcriptional regulator PpsR